MTLDLEQELRELKERNARVELDKAWEKSATRIGTIMAVTYVLAAIVFTLIGADRVLRNAVIPTLGYFLSTQSLPAVKKWWLAKR